VNEHHRGSRTSGFDREAHPVDGDAIDRVVAPSRAEEPTDLFRDWLRLALAIDTDEQAFGASHCGFVSHPAGNLAQAEAGSPQMGQGVLESQHIPGPDGRVEVEHAPPNRRRLTVSAEHVHSRPPAQHLPPRPLEQADERRLAHHANDIAVVREHGELDLSGWHECVGWGPDHLTNYAEATRSGYFSGKPVVKGHHRRVPR
jgi:hypothetical protein